MIYDTIYAHQVYFVRIMGIYLNFSHQDKYDDVIIGMKSTAIKFGDQTDLCLSCFATTMLSSLAYCGYQTGQTWPYYLSLGVCPDDCCINLSSQMFLQEEWEPIWHTS